MVSDQRSEDQALRLAADFLDYFEARSQILTHSAYVLAHNSAWGTGTWFGVDCLPSKTQRFIWGYGK